MGVHQEELLVQRICDLYEQISSLESLKPSKNVDMLFTQLVTTCIPHSTIDVTILPQHVQEIRAKLIRLCGVAEGLLESHYSSILGDFENPIDHLQIFPYYSNYLKLSQLEFNILKQHFTDHTYIPAKVAFIGSGPLPLTSIVLASNHLTNSSFHNYDIDPEANALASRLVQSDPDLSQRMFFHTTDAMDVTSSELREYDVVFLAALVGMDRDEKARVVEHLAKNMAPGALLMVRSAHGARAFLYPVVDPSDLQGFEVLSVYHPNDEVINSVVIARNINPIEKDHASVILPITCSKCSEIRSAFKTHLEELVIEEQLS